MKNKSITFVLIAFLLSSFCMTDAFAKKGEKNLYKKLLRKKVTRVYIADIVNHSEHENANVSELETAIAEVLGKKRIPKFQIVSSADEAELVISGVVTSLLASTEDPIDTFTGWKSIALDAMVDETFAAMKTRFEVVDRATDKVLWSDDIKTTVTEMDLSTEEVRSRVIDRMAKIFVKRCFNRPLRD